MRKNISRTNLRSINKAVGSVVKYRNADDVTRLNQTKVSMIYFPTTSEEIIKIIELAKKNGKKICMAGTHHTMGGHILTKGGYMIDMKLRNRILSFDKDKMEIMVEPGIKWYDLIYFLNEFGQTPKTLQSYSSFSVGGTISVNAHGITNDYGIYNSVKQINMILSSGERVSCSLDENRDLFSRVIGGYGLFGIIDSVVLSTDINKSLNMKMDSNNLDSFHEYFQDLLKDDKVDVKISRINVATFDEIYTTVFRNTADNEITSPITFEPKAPSKTSQLIYKWAVPTYWFQRMRFANEKVQGKPMDITKFATRNELLYETAEPLGQLYSPLIKVDRTHILQEYFIPKDSITDFLNFLKTYFTKTNPAYSLKHTNLLNITIRYLYKDDVTALKYAKQDSYALVFYYRIPRTTDAQNELEQIHVDLTDKTLQLNGTFYLPYLHHYNNEQLTKAYPEIKEFFESKKAYDPICLFSNKWFEEYKTVADIDLDEQMSNLDNIINSEDNSSEHSDGKLELYHHEIGEMDMDTNADRVKYADMKDHYYKNLLSTDLGRYSFKQFLTHVFNILPANDLLSVIYTEIENSKVNNADLSDEVIYKGVQSYCNSFSFSGIRNIGPLLKNLASQKEEMAFETYDLLCDLDLDKKFDSLMTVGDPGRYVTTLKNYLKIGGTTYVVHDSNSYAGMIERGSVRSVGKFTKIDYNNVETLDIPDSSVDLATMYIGLHHFSEENLDSFLLEMKRIVRSNGVFILRDHNGTDSVKPILHCAHSIYNAVTGETLETEKNEIRNFMSTKEWEKKLSEYGFKSSGSYKTQQHDPTENYLMCFIKEEDLEYVPASLRSVIESDPLGKRDSSQMYGTFGEWYNLYITQALGKYMEHTPYYRFPFIKSICTFWSIVWRTTNITRKKYGFRTAFLTQYTMMNLVLGSVFTGAFLGFSVISAPIRWFCNLFPDDLKIRLVVLHDKDTYLSGIDPRIETISTANKGENMKMSYVEVPRYLEFKDVLRIMSKSSDIKIIEVASNDKITFEMDLDPHEKVRLDDSEYAKYLKQFLDYKVIEANFSTRYAFELKTSDLLHVLKGLDELHFKITRICDF